MNCNQLTALPGRDPWAATRVAVYKNLHRGAWSVRAIDGPFKGKVVAHAERVGLVHAHMHVNERAQRRIAAGAAREVHAWVIGTLGNVVLTAPTRLTYRPHQRPAFFPGRHRLRRVDGAGSVIHRRRLGGDALTATGNPARPPSPRGERAGSPFFFR